jgi:hypothetical protein
MDSDSLHKDAVNLKTNGDTVLQWINPLREIGIMNDQMEEVLYLTIAQAVGGSMGLLA